MNHHLTEENFADLLFGASSAEVHAHLQACEACRLEAAHLSESIEIFKEQSLYWAELQPSARRPLPLFPRRKADLLRFPVGMRAAAAIALLATVAATYLKEGGHKNLQAPQQTTTSYSPDAQEKNTLLAIDQELSAEDQSPRVVYKLPSGATEQE